MKDKTYTIDEIGNYRCNACYKPFKTVWQYFGHKQSHRQYKKPLTRNVRICHKCKKRIRFYRYEKHVKECNYLENLNRVHICEKCGKTYKNQQALNGHKSRHGKNKDRGWPRKGWNKGLKVNTDERVRKAVEKLKKRYETGELIGSFKGKHHSEKTKTQMSKSGKGKNKGNPGWARVKKENNYIEQRVVNKLNEMEINFECQKQFSVYRVDIYLCDFKVIIECDGSQHLKDEHVLKDSKRDNFLINLGYRIIRFNALFIQRRADEIKETLLNFLNSSEKRKFVYVKQYADVA